MLGTLMPISESSMIACKDCKSMAVWSGWNGDNFFFCDEHVPRGCGCAVQEYDPYAPIGHPNLDIMIQKTDAIGRLIPCIEFFYSKDGFDDE